MKKFYKIGIGIIVTPILMVGVLFTILLIWGAIENHNGFSKDKLEELTNPTHYITGISNSEMEGILCQVEAWIDREEEELDSILEQPSESKQQSMAMDYVNNFDKNESDLIQRAIQMLNCTDFQDILTDSQQERKKILYAKINRHHERLVIIKKLFM